ncbi:hypothetical protein A8U91_02362 [Halomonas elongata]|uniref:Uncharacterized protein n=1 Tax=Halomonas elongata TaxID=2746 RepID=A0A1B8P6Y7_HALEL|nr:hypothetical protein A8U91_02362 [Halomonas elongata]
MAKPDQDALGLALDGLRGDARFIEGILEAVEPSFVEGEFAAVTADLYRRILGEEVGKSVDQADDEDEEYQQILPQG